MTVPARLPALVALLVLGLALGATLALTTPWSPLPSGPQPGAAVDLHRDFTTAELARENAFHRAVRPPAYAAVLVGLAAGALLALTAAGARLVELVSRPAGGGWAVGAALGGLAVTVLVRLATLPLDARTEAVLRRYGLSTQDWGSWLLDQLKGLALTGVVVVGGLLTFFALARAFPQRWWLPVGVAAAALTVAISFGYPLLVEPVFNKFTALPAGPLRTSLLQLAATDHVRVDRVLVADASRRTTALNAYVSGFGSTKRIVLYDTLLSSASPAEVRLVVAHELGHAKRSDVLHGTLEGALGAAAAAVLLFVVLAWTPLLRGAGATSVGDPRSLALVLFLLTLFGTLAGPVQTLVSRRIEARADVHALDLTRDPATFVVSERRLSLRNLSDLDPNPLVYGLFATHPTGPERIALARTWARRHGVPVPPAQVGG
ncbi:MAG: M48 family metallopeptidase [Mycobacteriales bacterium]